MRPGGASRHLTGGVPWLRWTLVALGGLALGFAALARPWQGLDAGGPGAVVMLRPPDTLLAAIWALLSLAALLLLALVLHGRIRRKRKDEEEFQLYYEPPKVSPWVLVGLLALALLPVALLIAFVWSHWTPFGQEIIGPPPATGSPTAAGSSPTPPPRPGRPAVSLPVYSGAVRILVLLAALASLGLVLWLYLGDHLAWWWSDRQAETPASGPLLEAVEAGLDDLRREPDARRAIILCYRRFEQWLARVGFPRAPSETPTEFMRQALARLPLSPEAVRTVTGLFEVARFSQHPVGPPEREAAVDALTHIKAALERAQTDATAA